MRFGINNDDLCELQFLDITSKQATLSFKIDRYITIILLSCKIQWTGMKFGNRINKILDYPFRGQKDQHES